MAPDVQSLGKTRRDLLLLRWGQLVQERASWVAHWKEISDNLLPRSGRFFVTDRNRGERRHNLIYDNCGPAALRVMASGIMAGATSPARPWFRLQAQDPELNDYQPVKLWLDDVVRRVLRVFQRSNVYRALHQMYEELGAFGTAASVVEPNYERLIHLHVLTAGQYCLATDWDERVNVMYREFQQTVGATVREFGLANCSFVVQDQWKRGQLEAWVRIVHAIEARDERDYEKAGPLNMPWRACYFELGENRESQYLREGGYQRFPVLAPRWATAGGDVYGNSPAMEALGDIKQLQHEQLRKAQGIDYKTKPPLQAPSIMKDRDVDMLPGGVTFVDTANPNGGIRPAFEARIELDHLLEDIRDVRERIRGSFYADLFLMLYERRNDAKITATEVAELHEEKLLMLGPVLERLHTELLEPLVDMTFARMLEVGALPPPPEEMRGMALNVEFVSMLAQAQRAIGVNAIDRFTGNLGAIAQIKPEVLDKFDQDVWADQYSDMLGVPPAMLVPDDKVLAIRTARNRAMAAKEQSAAIAEQAGAAKDLAAAPTTGGTALTDVMNLFSQGLGAAPGGGA